MYRNFLISHDPMVLPGLDWSWVDADNEEDTNRQGRAETMQKACDCVDAILDDE